MAGLCCGLKQSFFHPLPSHGTPRRLDAIFLNKTAAVCFHQYRVHDDSGIPSHHPIIAQIRLAALRALYAQLQKPKMLPSSAFIVTPDDDAIFLACWNSVSSDWSMHQSNPDELFAVFNRLVDQFLCARARIADARPFCGRGRFPVFKLQPAVATSRPVQHGGSQATCRERMLRKLARQIKSFLAQLPSLPSVWPYAIKQLHSKILHRAHILNSMCPISSRPAILPWLKLIVSIPLLRHLPLTDGGKKLNLTLVRTNVKLSSGFPVINLPLKFFSKKMIALPPALMILTPSSDRLGTGHESLSG